MNEFADAILISAGNSSTNARDYIVKAGSSIPENRDFIVLYLPRFIHGTSYINVGSSNATLIYLYGIKGQSSTINVESSSAALSVITLVLHAQTSSIQVQSSNTLLTRAFTLVSSQVEVRSGVGSLVYGRRLSLANLALSVASSNTNLQRFNALSLSAQPSTINVQSGLLTVNSSDKLQRLALGVYSGNLQTDYSRTLNGTNLSLGVTSGNVALNPFTAIVLQLQTSAITVSSGNLSTAIRQYASHQTCALGVQSSLTGLIYNRIFRLQSHALSVSSSTANLFFNSLRTSIVTVSSSLTRFGLQRRLVLGTSSIQVLSSTAEFKNPYLVGLNFTLRVLSGYADLRFLPTGYLPSTAPTTRSFQPPSYKIEKTPVFTGRTVRQIMCSKPSDALLTLEYLNVSDAFAEEMLTAYDESFGTRYGFKLPPEIVTGAGTDLLNYIRLNNSTLKWYFADKPSVEAVSKGLCNLNVQLKAKVEAR